ncbi:MAG: hypothetical protein MK060_01805 [Blastomonas sp.]|nr:hypothetical protein [Blastomonas sp.]
MVAIEVLWQRRHAIWEAKDHVQQRLQDALGDEDQMTVLTGQGNTAQAVKDRIALMVSILHPVE